MLRDKCSITNGGTCCQVKRVRCSGTEDRETCISGDEGKVFGDLNAVEEAVGGAGAGGLELGGACPVERWGGWVLRLHGVGVCVGRVGL